MSVNHFYLIKRGPRPEHHKAPFHPIIICPKKRIAKREANWSGEKAWVWERHKIEGCWEGFLLSRWNGLDIDYGHIVRGFALPDGTEAAFAHDPTREPYTLVMGAVWWDDKQIPKSLLSAGVIYPPDTFSRQWILDGIADNGCSGFGRAEPGHWPKITIPDDAESLSTT